MASSERVSAETSEIKVIRLAVAAALISFAAPAFAGEFYSFSVDSNGNSVTLHTVTPDFVAPPPKAHFSFSKVTSRDRANGDRVIRRTVTTEAGTFRTTKVVDRPSLGLTRSHGTGGWSGGSKRR